MAYTRKHTTSKRRLLRKSSHGGKRHTAYRHTSGCKHMRGKKCPRCRKSRKASRRMRGGSDGTAHYNKQHPVDKHAAPVA